MDDNGDMLNIPAHRQSIELIGKLFKDMERARSRVHFFGRAARGHNTAYQLLKAVPERLQKLKLAAADYSRDPDALLKNLLHDVDCTAWWNTEQANPRLFVELGFALPDGRKIGWHEQDAEIYTADSLPTLQEICDKKQIKDYAASNAVLRPLMCAVITVLKTFVVLSDERMQAIEELHDQYRPLDLSRWPQVQLNFVLDRAAAKDKKKENGVPVPVVVLFSDDRYWMDKSDLYRSKELRCRAKTPKIGPGQMRRMQGFLQQMQNQGR